MDDPLVIKAREYAKDKHRGQKDDVGKDNYTAHIEKVAEIVSFVKEDPEIIAAAYLHDVVEDNFATFSEIEKEFGQTIAGLVKELTKVDGAFPNLKTREAYLIKLADRLNNASRMENMSKEEREATLKRKNKFY
ncbi:HD domain-containing protein [Chloroflexota bacterium]